MPGGFGIRVVRGINQLELALIAAIRAQQRVVDAGNVARVA